MAKQTVKCKQRHRVYSTITGWQTDQLATVGLFLQVVTPTSDISKGQSRYSIFRAQLLVKLGPTYQYHWALVCMFPVTDDCLWSGFCLSREQSINVVTSKWSRRRGNHVQHVQVCNITIQPLSSFFSLIFKKVFIVNLVWFVFCIRQQ